jgi:protein-disulfide isomerase
LVLRWGFAVNLDRNTMIGLGVAGVLVVGGLGYWAATREGSNRSASGECVAKPVEVTDADYSLGKPDAPVTVVEYASMTCPHCARFTRETYPKFKENFVDKGYVRYVFREFPIDRVALTASVVGRCLPRDSYLPYVELLYVEFDSWIRSEDPRNALKEMARRAGMSGDEFEKCLSTEDDAKKIRAAQSVAEKDYCVGGTPSFFVDGKFYVAREVEYEEFETKLREVLKAKGVEVPAATPAAATTTPAEGAATAPAEGTAAPAADGAASTPAEGTATPAEPATAPPAP